MTVQSKCKSKKGEFKEHYSVTRGLNGIITCNFCGEVLDY